MPFNKTVARVILVFRVMQINLHFFSTLGQKNTLQLTRIGDKGKKAVTRIKLDYRNF
jgi:hypothetical protein